MSDFSDKLKQIVGAVAPTIATTLGGPLAGTAVASLLKVFNVTNTQDLEKAVATASPEQLVELKRLDLEFEKLDYEDRASARRMQEVALMQDDKFSKRFVYIFATAWSVFAICYLAAITFWPVPEANVRFADTVVGFLLGTIIATIMQYFYGSSMGSKAKDERIK